MEPLSTKELLKRMLQNTVEARNFVGWVATDAEETPIPSWLETEIGRILLALGHLEAQIALELESA